MRVVKSPNNVREFGESETSEIRDRILDQLEDVWEFFAKKNEVGERNLSYYMGEQWTNEEIVAHKMQNRRAYVFNETFSKIDHLIGTQTQTRMDAKIMPREKSDDIKTRLLNFIVKWFEQINDIEYTETEVFTDATIRAAGASVIRWRFEEIDGGYPSVEPIPINELYWDVNSQRVDLSDARWMARVQYVTRREAKEIFPEHTAVINDIQKDYSLVNSRIQNVVSERQKRYQQKNKSLGTDDDILPIVEYCEWELVPHYVVTDEIQNTTMDFDDEEEAEAFYEGLMSEYTEGRKPLLNPDGTPRIAMLETSRKSYMQTILLGDDVLDSVELDTPFFPWDVCFSYFNKGDYWAFANNMISPQDLINRAFSQLDYQLGATVKGAVTVIPTLLPTGFTMEKARQEWSKTSPMIPVMDHRAFNPIPPGRVQAELFQEVNFGIQRMTDYAGGKNALGLQENAAESGRAVIARAEQGGIGKLPLFDKLRLWRKNITYKAIWYIKNYIAPGQVLRIIGEDEEVMYINLDDGVLDSLREIKYDIVVDEAMKSETMKERYFQQLKELFAQQQYPPEITMPLMLEYSSIPESKKREIKEMLQFYKVYQQKQQEMQHDKKIEQEAADSVKRKQVKDMMEMSQKVDEKKSELASKQKGVKASLDKIERMRLELTNKGLSVEERNKLYDKLQTEQELAQKNLAGLKKS